MYYHYIKVRTNSKKELPPKTFLGSTIRGAMGSVLKEINPYLYKKIYEADKEYQIFRLSISKKSNNFDFGLYLFTNDIDIIRTFLTVIKKMLSKKMLTGYRYKFSKSELYLNDKKVKFNNDYTPKAFILTPKTLATITDTNSTETKDITLKFILPTLLKSSKNNPHDILEDVILSIVKRKYYFNYGVMEHRKSNLKEMPQISYKKITKSKLKYKRLYRKKSKSGQILYFEGIVGSIKIEGLNLQSYKILKQGEIISAGKQAVYGLGKIKIKATNEKIV